MNIFVKAFCSEKYPIVSFILETNADLSTVEDIIKNIKLEIEKSPPIQKAEEYANFERKILINLRKLNYESRFLNFTELNN